MWHDVTPTAEAKSLPIVSRSSSAKVARAGPAAAPSTAPSGACHHSAALLNVLTSMAARTARSASSLRDVAAPSEGAHRFSARSGLSRTWRGPSVASRCSIKRAASRVSSRAAGLSSLNDSTFSTPNRWPPACSGTLISERTPGMAARYDRSSRTSGTQTCLSLANARPVMPTPGAKPSSTIH